MTPDAERAVALRACPLCGSPKGERCLYLDVKMPSGSRLDPRYTKQWNRYDMNGRPTERPHNPRLVLVHRRRPAPPPVVRYDPITAEYLEAIYYLRRHDLREYQEMREWLLQHGHILWDSVDTVVELR